MAGDILISYIQHNKALPLQQSKRTFLPQPRGHVGPDDPRVPISRELSCAQRGRADHPTRGPGRRGRGDASNRGIPPGGQDDHIHAIAK